MKEHPRVAMGVDRGIILQTLVAFGLGGVQYLVLLLFLGDESLFWRSLAITITTVAATQTWIDAAAFLPARSALHVLSPALVVVVFGIVVAQSVAERGPSWFGLYGWSLLATFIAASHRQIVVHHLLEAK